MTYILCLETATTVCSVALCCDGKVVAFKESHEKNAHSSLLTVFIEDVLKEASIGYDTLSAIAVSKGPGSYTGLRIGVSTAKGLCYALDVPLIGVSTLHAMAYGMADQASKKPGSNMLFCPMIDARRMEVYTALFDIEMKEKESVEAVIIDHKSFEKYLQDNFIVFGGDGALKCKEVITSENALFSDKFSASAKYLSDISYQAYNKKRFEDIAYFEPFYLKEFIAGIPKVKGLK